MIRADQLSTAGAYALLLCLSLAATNADAVDAGGSGAPGPQSNLAAVAAASADAATAALEDKEESSASAESTKAGGETAEEEPYLWREDAEGELGATASVGDEEFSLMAMLSKLGLGLGVVVFLGWAITAVIKRSSIGRQFSSNNGVIQVMERNYLAPKKAIYLVQIGKKVLALGVTDAQIGLLSEWTAGELDFSRTDGSSSFAGHMRSMVSGFGRHPVSEVSS